MLPEVCLRRRPGSGRVSGGHSQRMKNDNGMAFGLIREERVKRGGATEGKRSIDFVKRKPTHSQGLIFLVIRFQRGTFIKVKIRT